MSWSKAKFVGLIGLAAGIGAVLALLVVVGNISIRTVQESRGWLPVSVHTDCPSGVQYLRSWGGSLTPRLNSDGQVTVDEDYCPANSDR
jgi:hypothetical protein